MSRHKTWLEPQTHYLKIIENPWYKILLKIQNQILISTTEFYKNKNISAVFMPVTTGSISSPMGLGSDSIPVKINLCGTETYLADSMQFMLEYMCRLSNKGAYYVMPSFRGEKADERHLCQFFHSEAEIPGKLEDIISLVEEYIKFLSKDILNNLSNEILKVTDNLTHIEKVANCSKPFPRITHDDAIEILRNEKNLDIYFKINEGFRSITSKGEKRLLEIYDGIVWITHFDQMAVPFYQANLKNTDKALNADLLFGIGEVVGCGERHKNADEVKEALKQHNVKIDEYEWYFKMKQEYPLKTSGFGMGVERFILWLLKHDDIRDCQILPRFNGEEIYI